MWRDSPIVEFVTVVVRRDDVEQEDVLGLHVEAAESELHLRKHLPGRGRLWWGSSMLRGAGMGQY